LEHAGLLKSEHSAQTIFISAKLRGRALADPCWVSSWLACLSLWQAAWRVDKKQSA